MLETFLVAPCSSSGITSNPLHYNSEGWIGHPLDPVGALFDTLAESSLIPETKSFDQYYGKGFIFRLLLYNYSLDISRYIHCKIIKKCHIY